MTTGTIETKKEVFTRGYEKLPTKKLNSSHAFIGDVIIFKRKECFIQGTVISYRPETVLVEIEMKISRQLGIENNLTVVNHKNYEVR